MKLFLKIISAIGAIILIGIFAIWFNNRVEIKYKKNGTYENNLVISFKHRFLNFGQDTWCKLSNDSNEISVKFENNNCVLSVSPGTYKLVLENKYGKLLLSNTNEIVITELKDFEIKQDEIYLIVDESETIEYIASSDSITWEYDNEVISMNNNTITVRFRDSMEQETVSLDNLINFINEKLK